jgi:hypothetical protein
MTIWVNLPPETFIISGGWMIIGIIYLAVTMQGFRKKAYVPDFSQV